MHNSQSSSADFQMNRTQAMVGAVLVGSGALIGMAGALIGGLALVSAASRWIHELEVPPTDVAKQKWSQAKAATQAGAQAWHTSNGVPAHSGRA
jgi:hypothetical protein